MSARAAKTRYAPSPTGPLHLGHARTHLVTYLLARTLGARIVMRIEDLDGPRVRPGAEAAILRDHDWLGLAYDEGPVRQSERTSEYERALAALVARGAVFACSCSRKDVEEASSAPHDDDGPRYPGTCRAGPTRTGRPLAMRFRFDAATGFTDRFLGPVPPGPGGDFVVRRADGLFAYQLAVVVDDAAMGITEVVRGEDLVASTPKQLALFEALGRTAPTYGHVPLVRDGDGERLAKRKGARPLAELRDAGVTPTRLLGALGASLGLLPRPREATLDELVGAFREAGGKLAPERILARVEE